MLPIVYTPTVGKAIERYSHEYRRPRGVFLSVDHPDLVEESFRNYGLGADDVDLIVATDAEGILGIGDWGVGGIEIAIGKLAVYIAAAGIHPRRVIPVVLDVGTDNLRLLNDPMYLGNRHAGCAERYDDFIDAYVQAATKLFPTPCCTGRTWARPTPADPGAVRRPGLHLQRRHAGHGRGRAGGGARRRSGQRDPHGRPAGGHPRRRHGRGGHRRHAPGGHGPRGPDAGGGHPAVLVPGPPGAAHRRPPADLQMDFQRPYARPAAEVAGWTRTGTGRAPPWPTWSAMSTRPC